MDIFQILNDAGLTLKEAASLFEVSRPTVYNWAAGVVPKSAAVYNRAMKVCTLVKTATERGLLPLAHDIKRADRPTLLHKVLVDLYREAPPK